MMESFKTKACQIKLCEKNTYCTCGNPNFRHNYEFHKPCYSIYEITIPTVPCGEKTFYLCNDCLKILTETLATMKWEERI